MKLLAAVLLIALLILTVSGSGTFESCSCGADDGSCSANVSCGGGCFALCPSDGCRAGCSGAGMDLMMQVSIQQTASNSTQLSSELARVTGQPIVFTPFNGDGAISFDVKRAVLWDVLDAMSQSGKVEIGGEDFSKLKRIRSALVTGEKMAFCVHNVSVQRIVSELTSLSGLPIRATSGDPKNVVNLSVKNVSLEEFLAQMGTQSGVEISLR